MADQIHSWNDDDGIGAIVIAWRRSGLLRRSRPAGFQPATWPTIPQAQNRDRGMRVGTNWTRLIRESKPVVIAAIQRLRRRRRTDLGAALQTCAYAAEETSVSQSASLRSVSSPSSDPPDLLAQLVGLGHATDICLSGRMVPADEAFRIGLVSAVVPKEDLFATALAKAEEYWPTIRPQSCARSKRSSTTT